MYKFYFYLPTINTAFFSVQGQQFMGIGAESHVRVSYPGAAFFVVLERQCYGRNTWQLYSTDVVHDERFNPVPREFF